MTQSPPPVLSTLSPERLRTVCTEEIHRPVPARELSVLVVEDDAAIRALLANALAVAGFRVSIAADGFSAVNLVRTAPPDVVVLDLGLPVLDGQEFLEAWRTAAPALSVPALVLSGSAERPPLLASVGVGGQIPKPFDIDPVVAAVGRLALGERA